MPIRSKEYLYFIRSQPCVVSGATNEIVAHHIRIGFHGMGTKPSDWRCVPLHNDMHQRLHNMGEKAFWEYHGLDWDELICDHLSIYVSRLDTKQIREVLESGLSTLKIE